MLCREKLGKVSLAKELSFDWPYLRISFFPDSSIDSGSETVLNLPLPGKGFNFYPGETSGTVQTGNLRVFFLLSFELIQLTAGNSLDKKVRLIRTMPLELKCPI